MITISIKALMFIIAGVITIACYLWGNGSDDDGGWFGCFSILPPLLTWLVAMIIWLVCWIIFV
jgi:hypothetical protein